MSKLTHYADLQCRPLGEVESAKSEVAFLIGRVMEAVHEFNVRSGNALAVAFPGMQVETSPGNYPFPGDTVRVFSGKDELDSFLSGQRIAILVAGGAFGTDPSVKPVGSHDGYVTFRRSRGSEKNVPGHVMRSERRMRKRMASGKCKVTEQGILERRNKLLAAKKGLGFPPFVNMRSSSTQSAFRLFIERQDTSTPGAETFSSYGLSTGGSAVPRI